MSALGSVSRGSLVVGFLVAGLVTPSGLAAQGVRGGADSVRVRVDGVERMDSPNAYSNVTMIEVRVAIDHAAGFHSWPDEPVVPPELKGLNPIATSIDLISAPDGVVVESIDWPDPVTVTVRYTSEPLDLLSFADTTIARLRVGLPADLDLERGQDVSSPGERIELRVQFQSCDEEYCYPPRREKLLVPLAVDR
jgi:hypothetical protein